MDWFKVKNSYLLAILDQTFTSSSIYRDHYGCLTNMPSELMLVENQKHDLDRQQLEIKGLRIIPSENLGAKPVLPIHNKWTDARLRLAERKELRRRRVQSSYLRVLRAIRDFAINIHYGKASFVFMNLDELRRWIELIPMEARNIILRNAVMLRSWGQ